MSSRVTRPRTRPVTHRSRRQRIAAGAVLATTGLLGTYLAAIRPQPTYASQNGGVQQGQGFLNPAARPGGCPIAPPGWDDTYVSTEPALRAAVTTADDSTFICITESMTLNTPLAIDDTTITLAGLDDSVVTLTSGSGDRLIYADLTGIGGDTLAIDHLRLTGANNTSVPGGALYLRGDSTNTDDTLAVTNAQFDQNRGRDGGAIYAHFSHLSIIDSEFSQNRADVTNSAGAVYHNLGYSGAFSSYISGSTFSYNLVEGSGNARGGALALSGYTTGVVIKDSLFEGNEAGQISQYGGQLGGAIWSSALIDGGSPNDGLAPISIQNSTFNNNEAASGGGAIWQARGYGLEVTSSVFVDNYSDFGYGGAVSSYGGAAITDSLFTRNRTVNYGGALFIGYGFYDDSSSITSSTFLANEGDYGGALFKRTGDLVVENSLFDGNIADNYGGAIYIANRSQDDTITYSTIINNNVNDEGAGVYVKGPSPNVTLQNSILFNNFDTGNPTDIIDAQGNSVLTLVSSTYTDNTSLSNVVVDATSVPGDPSLQGIADNGGPSIGFDDTYLPTNAPSTTSIAVGLADPDLLPAVTTDQVGTSRRTPSNTKTVGAIAIPGSAPTPPTPTPTYPPSAPLNVTGTGGDRSATITWTEPSSSGSFPITDYQVVLAPGGATCLVQAPALSCTIDGLTNGTAYTATARALNGSGWGPYSTASEPFTPENPTPPVTKTIVITGTRTDVRGKSGVRAFGTTTGLVGATVQARVRLAGQSSYFDGSTRTVRDDGSFTWSRRTPRKTHVFFIAEDGTIRSNKVVIQAK